MIGPDVAPEDASTRSVEAENARVLDDIRAAEEQIARGEAIPHEDAREMLQIRFRR